MLSPDATCCPGVTFTKLSCPAIGAVTTRLFIRSSERVNFFCSRSRSFFSNPRTAQTQEAKGDTSKSQAQGGENAAQTKKEQRRNTWMNEDGSIRPISKWSGVNFTDKQKADYVAGKAVKLENVTDKQGFHATMYIKFNPEKGRPYRYETNPDNAQQVAPSNESRTQVAVNNEGKTNEATKNLKEPLQKGQTAPKDDRQQQQQEKPKKKNNKGMKM